MNKKVTRALVSVSDKSAIVDLCLELHRLGIEILSTGGTAKVLAANNIPATEVSDYTGFPEMMDGRVKTLHPKVHGGILARRGIDDAVMAANGINPIDMVVVNLYPFEQTIANPACDLATAVENIDIGGPTMIRAAAKNHADVAVIVDPTDYASVIAELKNNNSSLSGQTRFNLALKSFEHTARYDTAIATYLSNISGTQFPETLNLQFYHHQSLRYGENPHQNAAFYREKTPASGTIAVAVPDALCGTSCTTNRWVFPAGTCTSKPIIRVPSLRASFGDGGGSVWKICNSASTGSSTRKPSFFPACDNVARPGPSTFTSACVTIAQRTTVVALPRAENSSCTRTVRSGCSATPRSRRWSCGTRTPRRAARMKGWVVRRTGRDCPRRRSRLRAGQWRLAGPDVPPTGSS